MATIPFTSNYQDISTNRGFQFRFHCLKCGNGYMSTFESNTLGTVASAAQAITGLFGGVFGGAAQSAEALRQAMAGPAHDAALKAAVEEIRPIFKQCSRCGSWVCEPVCWNGAAALCEGCAPDLNEEIASAQAQAAKQQVIEKVRQVDYIGDRNLSQRAAVNCPQCGAKTQGGKFCPECGATLAVKRKCGHCGTEAEGTPKFCPECGKPYGA